VQQMFSLFSLVRVWCPPSPPAATELAGLRERFGEYTLGGVTIIKQNEYTMKDVIEVLPNTTLINKTILANVNAQGFSVVIPRCASGLKFQIDALQSSCSSPMPYVTGVYDVPNWTVWHERRHHLVFIGSTWRRKGSGKSLLDGLAKFPLKVHMPMIIQTHEDEARKGWKTGNISVLALSTYFESRFSIHPPGDSLTRRGFYESVLMGCIPVVPSVAYDRHYSHVVGRNSPEHIIHIPDKTFYNATLLLQHLDQITPARTQTLQTNLRRVAPFYTFSFAWNASFWTLVRDRLEGPNASSWASFPSCGDCESCGIPVPA
jgi:hypothetical protein